METSKSPNKAIIALIVIVLLVVAATVVIVMSNNKPSTDTATTATPSTSAAPSTSVPSNAAFKDGTYNATGSYQTPGGQESIGVKVTLSSGTISDASVTQMGKTGEAQEFQADFASGFKSQVVGKKVSEVSLSRVAGSSLTSNGFNAAINDIEKQANV